MLGIVHPSTLSSIRQVGGGIRIQTSHLGRQFTPSARVWAAQARVLVNTIGTEPEAFACAPGRAAALGCRPPSPHELRLTGPDTGPDSPSCMRSIR
jgi:hypothetical protein